MLDSAHVVGGICIKKFLKRRRVARERERQAAGIQPIQEVTERSSGRLSRQNSKPVQRTELPGNAQDGAKPVLADEERKQAEPRISALGPSESAAPSSGEESRDEGSQATHAGRKPQASSPQATPSAIGPSN